MVLSEGGKAITESVLSFAGLGDYLLGWFPRFLQKVGSVVILLTK